MSEVIRGGPNFKVLLGFKVLGLYKAGSHATGGSVEAETESSTVWGMACEFAYIALFLKAVAQDCQVPTTLKNGANLLDNTHRRGIGEGSTYHHVVPELQLYPWGGARSENLQARPLGDPRRKTVFCACMWSTGSVGHLLVQKKSLPLGCIRIESTGFPLHRCSCYFPSQTGLYLSLFDVRCTRILWSLPSRHDPTFWSLCLWTRSAHSFSIACV